MKTLHLSAAASCFALLQTVAAPATAADRYSGTTSVAWSAPVLSGVSLDAATGVPVFQDFSSSAACNLAGCPTQLAGYTSSTLAFGDYIFLPLANPTSTITFTPARFGNIAPNETFKLGTLTYLNGTSTDIIFGATLTIGIVLDGGAPVVDPFIVNLAIVTTTNTGTDTQNADFLDFQQAFGTTRPITFNVYENATATADLYGSIVGDPYLTASSIVLEPGSAASGFIGSGLPIPEPSTWAMLTLGLAGVGARAKRVVRAVPR